jgi:hypothetical protein
MRKMVTEFTGQWSSGRSKRQCGVICRAQSGPHDRVSAFGGEADLAGSAELPYAKLCQLGIALQLEKQCPLPIVELLGATRKNGLVNADTYRLLDRCRYRSRCTQRHPGAASCKPRSAVYLGHWHGRRSPWEPRHSRAQIGFTKCKFAKHCSTRNRDEHFTRCARRHHTSAESID